MKVIENHPRVYLAIHYSKEVHDRLKKAAGNKENIEDISDMDVSVLSGFRQGAVIHAEDARGEWVDRRDEVSFIVDSNSVNFWAPGVQDDRHILIGQWGLLEYHSVYNRSTYSYDYMPALVAYTEYEFEKKFSILKGSNSTPLEAPRTYYMYSGGSQFGPYNL